MSFDQFTDSAFNMRSREGGLGLLPSRPRFLQDLVVIPFEGGIAIDGAYCQVLLKNDLRPGLTRELVALMDGTRSIEQLAGALRDVSRQEVRQIVSFLFSRSLLEDAAESSGEAYGDDQALSFYRRYAGVTKCNQNGAQVYRKLKMSSVAIFDAKPASLESGLLRSLLEDSGVGLVNVLNSRSLETSQTAPSDSPRPSLIISLSLNGEDCEWHGLLDDWCTTHKVTWLRATLDEDGKRADVGPLFKWDVNPCYRCFIKLYSGPACPAGSMRGRRTRNDVYFLTSIVATEAIYFLTKIGSLSTSRDFVRYETENWTSKRFTWSRIPGCPRCRPLRPRGTAPPFIPGNRDQIETAVVFEDYVGLQSRPGPTGQTSPPSESRSFESLARQAKRLDNCRQHQFNRCPSKLECDALVALTKDGFLSDRPIAADVLGEILLRTAGIRDLGSGPDKLQRWPPTAGNLGSVELFVAVGHVDGLVPGSYFYQPHDHALSYFQQHDSAMAIEEFMRHVALEGYAQLPEALILLSGAFDRVARKYGPFAYRLVNLDAGAAVAQLLLTAKSLNVHAEVVHEWRDEIIEEYVNLEPLHEQVTAVIALRRQCAAGSCERQPSENASRGVGGTPFPKKKVSSFREMTAWQITEMLYCESRGRQCEPQFDALMDSHNSLESLQGREFVDLPAPKRNGMSVQAILERRVSVRHYTPERLFLRELSTILQCALRGDRNDWTEEYRTGRRLEFLVFAQGVSGLDAAVYLYDERRKGLFRLADSPSFKEMMECFVQPEFASAPLFVWIVGNLAAACAHHGSLGHRLLLLRAGAAAHRLWLGALAIGLSGCIVAGLVPGAGRRQIGLDGYMRASLVGFVVGHGIKH